MKKKVRQRKNKVGKNEKSHYEKIQDGYINRLTKTGIGVDNSLTASEYVWQNLSDNQKLLEAMYGTSWIVGACVDTIAQDMTRKGIEIHSSNDPDEIQKIQAYLQELNIWDSLLRGIKWGRLYGGALAIIEIDGQTPSSPLKIETVGKDQFSGLTIYDRWTINPDLNNLIKKGIDAGLPAYYTITQPYGNIDKQITYHHSRCIRLIGDEMVNSKAKTNQRWGATILQRIFDRLVTFDQLTMSTANLVQKSNLTTIKIEDLRSALVGNDAAIKNMRDSFQEMSLMQSAQGITLVDSKDQVENFSYNFSGLSDIFLRNSEQVAGAAKTPIIKLFKQSPSGLTSTGETDMEQYRDTIQCEQSSMLRRPMRKILEISHMSLFGTPIPEDFNFEFKSLKELSEKDKADIANSTTNSVVLAMQNDVIERYTSMEELKQSSAITGIFSNITDEQIEEAKLAPPPIPELQQENPDTELEVKPIGEETIKKPLDITKED